MKKILSILICIMILSGQCFGVDINDWQRGDSSSPIKGTDNISDIDTYLDNYLVDPLERLLTEEIHGCLLTYATAATVTIGVGEVTCYNSSKTQRRMRRNTSTVTITLPASGASGNSLDTGNAAVSTWYYVYAIADADATTFTGICSASASAPTGASYSYFRLLGAFYNNASDNILEFYQVGDWVYWITDQAELAAGQATSFTDVDCSSSVPAFSKLIDVYYSLRNDAGAVDAYWRVNGSANATGHLVTSSEGTVNYTYGHCRIVTDSSQIFEYKISDATGVRSLTINVSGYSVADIR